MKRSKLTPREARDLVVSPKVRALIQEIRSLEGVGGPATDLEIGPLETMEDEWNAQLPDDVLAVMASNSRWLTDLYQGNGIALENLGSHLESFYRHHVGEGAIEQEWTSVPVAKRTLVPFGGGGGGAFICLRRSELQERTENFVVVLHEGYDFLLAEKQEGEVIPFLDWLTQQRDALKESLKTSGRPVGKSSPPFEPKLVGQSRKVIATRRVVHPTFGIGTVVGQNGDKLEIDFESAGKKMLLEAFVKPA